ncbi:MAG: Piwi domain-containing protein [Linnemannia gamsii]|nr:MAG: Piwi domain-containing protein [Linnemannia gamsii]
MSAPIKLTELVKRPGLGKAGKAIKVRSNFFEVKALPDINIHHYDVTITPDVPPPVNRRIFDQFVLLNSKSDLADSMPVFDGRKNLFSAKELPFESRTFEVTLPGEQAAPGKPVKSFRLKVKKAASINLEELHLFLKGRAAMSNNCLTAIMALDVLIHHKPAMLYTTIGRSFFTPEGKMPLPGGLEVWRGYYQSMRPGVGRMLVNIDISSTAFFQSGSLIELVCKAANVREPAGLLRLGSHEWKKIEKFIKGLRVKVTHRSASSRGFKIAKLSDKSAEAVTFTQETDSGPKSTNVAAYFRQVYKTSLRYPKLRCITVGRDMVLPMEVCTVVEGQRYPKKLDERQTAEMITFAALPPHDRENSIKNGLRVLDYGHNQYHKNFGLTVSNESEILNARVLPAPGISYHPSSREANFVPRDGAWNLVGKKVLNGASLGYWGVVVFGTERDFSEAAAQHFVRELSITCQNTGMQVPNKNPRIGYLNPHGEIEVTLRQQWLAAGDKEHAPQLLLVVLPNTGVPLYAEIKRVTDTVLGVASQCVQIAHARKAKVQYLANVCLKINVKLGGTNSAFGAKMAPFISEKPTIIFGADVNHPAPGDSLRPSIAAVVASVDNKCGKYATAIRTQEARLETIQDLEGMVTELLRAFYTVTKVQPARILFYRDGVSEGEFAKVLKEEVGAIRSACRKLNVNYAPKITFVVVQKRHHARFFPSQRELADRSGNCQPGTVIDTGIVHPFEFDFYLQSHAGLLGTSRPVHYNVLHDDNQFTADALQELTYRLCYLYARCTRSVSLVPAAYYAHLVAQRARFHTKGENWSETSPSEGMHEPLTYAPVKPRLQNVMWFM